MEIVKQKANLLAKSKRMWVSTIFNAAFVIPLIYEATTVKEQADGILSNIPYGNYIAYAIVAAHIGATAWTKIHDDSKQIEIDDFEMQTQYAEMIAQQEILAADENEQNKDSTDDLIGERNYFDDGLHNNREGS